MQRLMGFSLCLQQILSQINIPALLSSVCSCTLYSQFWRTDLPRKAFLWRTEGTLQLQSRSREGWARPLQTCPSPCCGSVQVVSQFPWPRRHRLGWAGLSQQRMKIPGLAVLEPAQDRAPWAEGGPAAERAKSRNLAIKESSERFETC